MQATQALIAETRAREIAAKNCICTGDVVAYCADAAATVATIRKFGCPVVAGNCEAQPAAGAMDCGCGFDQGSACDNLSAGWYDQADSRIGSQDRAWMRDLPETLTLSHQRQRFAVIYGGATDIVRFIWPVSNAALFAEEIAAIEAQVGRVDCVLAGHSGIAFAREIGGKRWINAGVIGRPPHEGRAKTRFAVLAGDGVVFHRLAYNHGAARAAIIHAGMTQGYHDSLQSGVWPNEEVLPLALRRQSDCARG